MTKDEKITHAQQRLNYKVICLLMYGATIDRLRRLQTAWDELEQAHKE